MPKLRRILDGFLSETDGWALIQGDPVEIVHDYEDLHDQEVVAFIVALLAYGRVASIKEKARTLLKLWDGPPAEAVDNGNAATRSQDFVYRFQRGDDFPVLLRAVAVIRARYGSLAHAFAAGLDDSEPDYAAAMERFVLELQSEMPKPLSYGQRFLLPRTLATKGSAKRLCLFLRWMIRGGQPVTLTTAERDLGTWQKLVPNTFDASKLIIPLDTHIARISRFIGLTDRTTTGLTTAQEITESLRRIHPTDPLKYDMALCHLGISGSCPKERDLEKCAGCPITQACRLGKTPPRWNAWARKKS